MSEAYRALVIRSRLLQTKKT